MALEEKIEALTAEIIALRKTMEGNAGSVGEAPAKPAAAAKKAAPAKKAPAKKVTPKHGEDEVAAVMRQAAKDVDKDAIVEYIKEQGCKDLAELLTKPELFDAAYDFATGMLPEDEEEEDDDGEI